MTRLHDVSQLTTAELETARRHLRANLGLITPGSPAHAPILAHMQAIDAELAGRAGGQQRGEGQRHDSGMVLGPPPALGSAGRDPGVHEPRRARDLTPNGTRLMPPLERQLSLPEMSAAQLARYRRALVRYLRHCREDWPQYRRCAAAC